ncbi:MAG TPA: nitroreductase family protein [Rhodocyclaceae bacterium]|nr:nitroreductase family protein [Rhodocyclaceae bacterium]
MTEISAREAIGSRRSVRGFLPTLVPRATVEAILELASRAPSGSNIQPWQAYVCMGDARKRISSEVQAAYESGAEGHQEEYRYYPRAWREPYQSRRRKIGKDLYGALGITRDDKDGMRRHFGRNYDFFGAPVGIFFAMDRDMEIGSWLDLGMFMQNVMTAARIYGLETCAQQAHAQFHRIICPIMGIPESQMLICGMALGYEDRDEPANRLITERAPVQEFVRFVE